MSYTPEQLRKMAANMADADMSESANQLRAHADLIERFAKLKEHAEAMADLITRPMYPQTFDEAAVSVFMAYRRDFPKEEK